MLPIVAIIGKPNVGKSTLFNRMIGKRLAIESKFPGTTRDYITHTADLQGMKVILADTGGLEFEKRENIEAKVQEQARIAIKEAHLIIFLIDLKSELNSSDIEGADLLRKSGVPVILAANKAETKNSDFFLPEFYRLGLGDPVKISALNGIGIAELEILAKKRLLKLGFKDNNEEIIDPNYINLAIVGRPNVGKSSLINALLKQERLIVSDIAGTTRDSIDTFIKYEKKDFKLIDTAGLKRRGKTQQILEKFSLSRSLSALERCDIAVLLLDFNEGITNQDCHAASYILEMKKGLIIAVNKCDLIDDPQNDREKFAWKLERKMNFLSWAPVVFVSAKTGKNIYNILDLAIEIKEERQKRIGTNELNNFLARMKMKHPPEMGGSHNCVKPKIYYATQAEINPPHFIFFVNDYEAFHFSYRRFIENSLREEYGFAGTAIKVDFKNRRREE